MSADVFVEITNSIDEEAQGARPVVSWGATRTQTAWRASVVSVLSSPAVHLSVCPL